MCKNIPFCVFIGFLKGDDRVDFLHNNAFPRGVLHRWVFLGYVFDCGVRAISSINSSGSHPTIYKKAIDNLDYYCLKWGITVNVRKTKVVVFRKPCKLAAGDKWVYRGNEIEIVSVFKYLGCYLSLSGSFSINTKELVKSARRALFALKVFFGKYEELTPSLQLMFLTAWFVQFYFMDVRFGACLK